MKSQHFLAEREIELSKENEISEFSGKEKKLCEEEKKGKNVLL